MINGFLPLNKPSGISSFQVIFSLKRHFKELKKLPMGHSGTLDPEANGLLIILFGEAVKLFNYIQFDTKIYIATIKFGELRDTDDLKGKTIEKFDKKINLDEIKNVINNFIGEILQLPPKYSALKINGERSYNLARKNVDFDLKKRKVFVKSIEILDFDYENQLLKIKVECGSGVYIRSLARDIGMSLNNGGYIFSLTRIYNCGIHLDEAYNYEELFKLSFNEFQKLIKSSKDLLKNIRELKTDYNEEYFKSGKILNRNIFKIDKIEKGIYKIIINDKLIALIEYNNEKFRYLRVFNE